MISIVIIGKNESKNLPTLFESLNTIKIAQEIIYVDSSSTDNSVEIAKKYCDSIYKIEFDRYNSASAGRYVGTLEAKYSWILYLDGDMILKDDFIKFLNEKDFLNDSKIGYIGYYKYIYSDGSVQENVMLQPKNNYVNHFGGAVFFNKEIVLKAGNWNPSIVGNEEIDLYARIQKQGYKVYGLGFDMVDHQAKKISNIETLKSLFLPMNRRFYGFGQVLASQKKFYNLLFFMKIYPYTFLMFFSMILLFFGIWYPLIFLFFFVSWKKRYYYNILYLSDIIKGIFGFIVYKEYVPKYKIISL